MAALLVAFLALVWSAAGRKCETWDEGLFIAGGVVQVERRNPNLEFTHPPLPRWLAGVPAVMAGARAPEGAPLVPAGPTDLRGFRYRDTFDYARRLLYAPGHDHDRVLAWGRWPFALLAAICAWLVFREALRLSPWIAATAAGAFLFLPEVMAHAGWAHSDVAATLATLLIALALVPAIERGTVRAAVLLGLALGFAAGVKLTGLLLWPVALLLLLVFPPRRRALRTAVVALAVGWVAIVAVWLPEPRLGPHAFLASDLEAAGIGSFGGLLRWMPLPDTMLKGIVHTLLISRRGQPAFFHGEISTEGWWAYFPVAIFLKYPTGLLLVALVGLVALWRNAGITAARKAALTAPPLVVLAAAMTQSMQIGVRSVLPLAPFLALWSAEALAAASRRGRVLLAVLLASSMLSGITAYPDFLAYFNPLMGGTRAADRWLVDSNLDWGQDLPGLSREIERRGIDSLRLAYFGAASPEHYGIRALPAREVHEGWYAVSRTYLSGLWPPGDPFGWLRALEPVTLVGGSIALFDVREQELAAAWQAGGRAEVGLALGRMRLAREPGAALATFEQVLARHPGNAMAQAARAAILDSLASGH